jgi:hypothetical protein
VTLRHDNDETGEALRAYGRLLGLAPADLEDPELIEETAALTSALAAAAERDLGDAAPAPLFAPTRS